MKRFVRLGLRAAILALLAAAIADLPVPAGTAPRSRAYAIDASGSVGPAAARDAWRAFEQDRARLSSRDRAAFLAFGARPIPFSDRPPEVDRDATDLGAAIEAAAAEAGDDGEVVLATDGRDTAGRLDRALLAAAARGIPVHVMPVAPPEGVDVTIAAVDAPASAPPGSRVDVRVTIESTGPAKGSLNGAPFEFETASRQVVVLRDLQPGRIPLVLDVVDVCPENNSAEVTVIARTDAPRIRAPAYLAKAFPPSWVVETGGRPEEFDAVIIDALDLAAARAVRDGGMGLLVLGGPRSYAPGGFEKTEIEDVMPLWAFPDERSTVVFVMDRSGSMNGEVPALGRKRIDVAAAALRSSLDLVRADDSWAVVAFPDSETPIVPLRQGRLELPPHIPAAGPTHILPALDRALAEAEGGPSGRKLVVLVTDGETQENDADLDAMGRRLAERGARLVIFETGAAGMPKLKRLGGTLIPVHDITKLSDVMRRELARSRELILENARPAWRDDPLTKGLPAWPALPKTNRTGAKKTARLLASVDDQPVLALGTAGRGTVAAATFSLDGDWAGGLATWPGLSPLLQRLVEHVLRPAPGVSSASAHLDGDQIVFSVRRSGGGDSLDAQPVRLLRRGEDLYEGRIPAPAGTTVLRIDGRVAAAFTLPHPREYDALGPDSEAIERITRRTGGRFLSRLADLEALPPRREPGSRPGRPVFLIAALAIFLADLLMGTFWRANP